MSADKCSPLKVGHIKIRLETHKKNLTIFAVVAILLLKENINKK